MDYNVSLHLIFMLISTMKGNHLFRCLLAIVAAYAISPLTQIKGSSHHGIKHSPYLPIIEARLNSSIMKLVDLPYCVPFYPSLCCMYSSVKQRTPVPSVPGSKRRTRKLESRGQLVTLQT